jgi:nicotinate (nicotinamide) nucleotide adenylyltransferase
MDITNALNVFIRQSAVRECPKVSSEFLESWEDKNNRVIVFAGVFDPVHKGHISAAQDALQNGREVVFLPERAPQHKHQATEYKHRLEMLKIATKSQKNISVLDYPFEKQFIEETFSWLKTKYPDRSFTWLIGSDVLEHIPSWSGSEKLSKLGVKEILVYAREDYNFSVSKIKEIGGAKIVFNPRKRSMKNHSVISSSYILEDIKHRQSALADGVYDYIKENSLYNAPASLRE